MNRTVIERAAFGKRVAAVTLCPAGIVSSMLAMCAIWRKLTTDDERTSFYVYMAIISILDFIFNATYITINWAESNSWLLIVAHSLTFSSSLASDLCALALTAERYVTLRWPQMIISPKIETALRVATGLIITVMASTRARYVLHDKKLIQMEPSWYKWYRDNIAFYMSTFTDMIWPMVSLFLMIFFSLKIISIVTKRSRFTNWTQTDHKTRRCRQPVVTTVEAQVGESTTNSLPSSCSRLDPGRLELETGTVSPAAQYLASQRRQKREKAKSTISLVLVLDILFLLNQLGYCAAASNFAYQMSCGYCDQSIEAMYVTTLIGDTVECLTRSLNFYFYVVFSKMMKDEFKAFVLKLGKALKIHS